MDNNKSETNGLYESLAFSYIDSYKQLTNIMEGPLGSKEEARIILQRMLEFSDAGYEIGTVTRAISVFFPRLNNKPKDN